MSELKLSLSARRRAIACSTSPRSNRPKRGAAALSSSAAGQKPLAQSRSSDSFACFEEETNEDTENECVNTASITVAATAAAKQPLAAKPNPSHRRTFAAAHAASKAVAATASISTAARSADPQRTEKFPLMASTALSAHLTARDNCSLRRAAIASPERPANEWQD